MAFTAVASALILCGCASIGTSGSAGQKKLMSELKVIDPFADPLPSATPIIDIHTHTFNARYLPLRGILLGKRDSFWPFTSLISDKCAKLVAQGIIDRTELSDISIQPGIERKADTSEIHAVHPGLICRIFLGVIDKAISRGVWSSDKTAAEQMKLLDEMAEEMNLAERLAIRSAMNMMGMQDHVKGGKEDSGTISGIQAAVRFLWTITQADAQMPRLYRSMHSNAPVSGKITLVSHMMDLGPVYDQDPDGKNLLDFTNQIKRMEYYQEQSASGLIYFVAYCPYRSHFKSSSNLVSALDVVRDGVLNHNAKGVKVYPPSGYRPINNQIKPRPCTFSSHPRRQWDARYVAWGKDKNEDLDGELNELLEWCIEQDVPVLVHSGFGEFEARKGYGEHHSNPKFWKQFLESHSQPGYPCKLRLCLGHAGGEDYWFGTGIHREWGRTAFELCTNYPNVYCEVTSGEAMLNQTARAHFADLITRLFVESAATPYPFATKLMYGTDWPLPDKGEPHEVLLATQKVFLLHDLKPHYVNYFSGNAKRFLNLPP